MKLNLDGNENGINETPKKLKKHEWKIIGGRRAWKRICSNCNNEIWHFKRDVVYRKSNLNRLCRECWRKNKMVLLERKCPNCNKNIIYKTYKSWWNGNHNNGMCKSCSKIGNPSRKGQKCSEEHKKKVGLSNKGKIITKDCKYKMRLAAINRIKQKRIKPYTNYNPNACKYFDELNKQNGWNLQHALNGGEIECYGYFIDAYDKERNLVVEYDEPRHNRPSIKEKDLIRQENIIKELKCEFYRFNETNKTLTKITGL